jgi:hypothetical protein
LLESSSEDEDGEDSDENGSDSSSSGSDVEESFEHEDASPKVDITG